MILWSFFWKNGYNVTSQILVLCIVNWSMIKKCNINQMKTYAMVLIMKKHRKQNELFLQYGYKLNCSKMKISLNLYKIQKMGKSHKRCAKSRNSNENDMVTKCPTCNKIFTQKIGKEQNLNTLKSCISNKITKKSLGIWNDDCENFSNMRHKSFHKSKIFSLLYIIQLSSML